MKQYSEEEFLDQVLRISSVNGMDDEGKLAWSRRLTKNMPMWWLY